MGKCFILREGELETGWSKVSDRSKAVGRLGVESLKIEKGSMRSTGLCLKKRVVARPIYEKRPGARLIYKRKPVAGLM